MDFSFARDVTIDNLYDIIGETGISGLTTAFYRQVPQDEILMLMYPEGELQVSEMRLREFLIFRCGGPLRYIEQRGHPQLRMRHAPFPIDQRARDRWVALMEHALNQMAFAPKVTTVLRSFFQEVATFLINREK